MMVDAINTTFEVSLRVLLTLRVADGNALSADMIAALDFITVYGRDFGIARENLHGENNYKFGEFALRRELVIDSLKSLVLDAFINAYSAKNGFGYSINHRGKEYTAKFNSDYAVRYCDLSAKAQAYFAGLSERQAIRRINEHSILSLQRGEAND